MVALMRMKSQEDNSHRYHHLIPFERVDLCTNCRMLDNRKASVGYTMIKLAAQPSCASSCTGDNRIMKLLGALFLVATYNCSAVVS